MMCCGKCSKWQHIPCHDNADSQAGRPKRNWDTEDFICRKCRPSTTHGGFSQQRRQYLPTQDPNRLPLPAQQPLNTHARPPFIHSHGESPAIYTDSSRPHTPAAKSAHHSQNQLSRVHTRPPAVSIAPVQQSRPYQSQSAITFTHYQPQERGFSAHGHQHQPDPVTQTQPYTQQHSSYGLPTSQYRYPQSNSPSLYSHQVSFFLTFLS
jgi:hypothetical protein